MKTIAQQINWDFETNGSLAIKDKNCRILYQELSNGWWAKSEYDLNGNEIFHYDSSGFWVKREYNSQGNQIYYENSYGIIIDNQSKPCKDATIEMLRDVDGETMEHIIRAIGMEEQMLRQLMLTAPMEKIEYLIEEKNGNQKHNTNKLTIT